MQYTLIVITIVAISSIAMVYLLNKNNLLKMQTALGIGMSSIIVSLLIPVLFGKLIGISSGSGVFIGSSVTVFIAVILTIMIFIFLVLILTLIISSIISEKRALEIWKAISVKIPSIVSKSLGTIYNGLTKQISTVAQKLSIGKKDVAIQESQSTPDKTQVEDSLKESGAIATDTGVQAVDTQYENNTGVADNQTFEVHIEQVEEYFPDNVDNADGKGISDNSENYVDTAENIDKMGIENVDEAAEIFNAEVDYFEEKPIFLEAEIPGASDNAEEVENPETSDNLDVEPEDAGVDISDYPGDMQQTLDSIQIDNVEPTAEEQFDASVLETAAVEEFTSNSDNSAEIQELINEAEAEQDDSLIDEQSFTQGYFEQEAQLEVAASMNLGTAEEVNAAQTIPDEINHSFNVVQLAAEALETEESKPVDYLEDGGENVTYIAEDLKNESTTDNIEAIDIENVEERIVDSESSLDECIDEAFKLKQGGDYEGAILYYMYALDKSPDKDLVFWVVLDICVLYKNLGQAELAREILESYVSSYGNIMDITVKQEIERNLTIL